MARKASKEEFLEVYVKQCHKHTAQEMADTLGISRTHLFNLKRKYLTEFTQASKDYARELSCKHMGFLDRNGEKGDTRASQLILEIADVHTPRAKLDVDGNITINVTERYIQGAKALAQRLVKGVAEGDGSIVDEGE